MPEFRRVEFDAPITICERCANIERPEPNQPNIEKKYTNPTNSDEILDALLMPGHAATNGIVVAKSPSGCPKHNGSVMTTVTIRENPFCTEDLAAEKGGLVISGGVHGGGGGGNGGGGNHFRVKILEPSIISRMTVLERYLTLAVSILAVACLVIILATNSRMQQKTAPTICLTPECVKTAASLMKAMDFNVDPCEDFFQFACGSWNRRHVIPEDRSSISTFEVLADDLQILLKAVLEKPLDEPEDATSKAKLFYKSCMNTSQIHELGDAPIKRVLDELGGWPVVHHHWNPPKWSTERLLGLLRGKYNQGIIVEQWVGPDDKNSSANVIQLDQMSLGLPGRDYFLKESSLRELEAYHKLMADVAILLGADRKRAQLQTKEVIQFEMKLANASLPEAERHDTGAIYKKLNIRELRRLVPRINWLDYLNAFLPTKVLEDEPIVVYALPYLKQMGRIIAATEKKVIHNYALWRLILEFLPYMGEEYQTIRAEFQKVIWGISADRIRWNQCVVIVNKRMGMAVGALFVRDNFNYESKETAVEMISNLREAFNELLAENDWMDEATRMVARDKANAMNERIGYPELLTNREELNKEYDLLQIDENNFFENVFKALSFEASKNLKKLRQPVNKDRWTTEPAVVNAFYNPNKNDIVFPAGILQPIFYSQHFPKSLNYGGIGVVIGHELTHGFDDKGRQFDKEGNLKQWWNNATIQTFRNRAQCIIDQYSKYVLDEIGLPVNGKMTQGENIADNGGLKQAFRAYKKWTKKNGEEQPLPGINLNHDQLFFLNYAQIWCGTMRPEDALNKIRSSVHSPGPIRVLGPLSNSYDFAEAYKCPLNSRMNPAHKCTVW